MALRPKPKTYTGDVPPEMLSKADPVWASEGATRAWLRRYGLEWEHRMAAGPLNRHERSSQAWAMANEFTQTFSSGFKGVDWRRLREAGVPGWGGAEISEYLEFLGVEDRR